MTIFVKNKHTLQIDEFKFKCCIGKKGSTWNKKEGDKKTPKGKYSINKLYYRSDRLEKPLTKLKTIKIKKEDGWCDDVNFPSHYNKKITVIIIGVSSLKTWFSICPINLVWICCT